MAVWQGLVGACDYEPLVTSISSMLRVIRGDNDLRLLVSGAEWEEKCLATPDPTVYKRQSHPCHELAYVHQGSCTLTLEGDTYRLRQGDLLLVAPGENHYERPEDPSNNYTMLWMQIQGSRLMLHGTEYLGSRRSLTFVMKPVDTWFGSNLEAILSEVAKEAHARSDFSEPLIRGYLITLIAIIGRHIDRLIRNGEIAGRMPVDHIVSRVITFIHREYANSALQVEEMANHVGLSRNYLIDYFRNVTGQSPYQYLLQFRMEQARKLLATEKLTVASIADQVGFSSPHHFSAMFKERTGVTPTQFRKEVKCPINAGGRYE